MSNYYIQKSNDEFRAGFFQDDPFKQKEKRILVLQTAIAGIQFHIGKYEDKEILLNSLEPGVELKLYRDIDNEYDDWAIAVYTLDDRQIGYVSRYKNETIARLMDAGKKFVAIIDKLEENDDDDDKAPTENYNLPFSIYMIEK